MEGRAMPTETVLITGASSGIGLELAKLFAADRSDLILVARSADRLSELANSLSRDHGVGVRVLAKDLSLTTTPAEIVDELDREKVAVDVLVNNAGFGARGPVAELDLKRQMEMVQVNV